VAPRRKSPFPLLAGILLALAAPVRAQVSSPTLVEEGEPPVEEPVRAPPQRPAKPAKPSEPALHTAPARRAGAPPQKPGSLPPTPGAAAPELPLPPPPPTPPVDLARQMVPVSTSWSRLMEHWSERRTAIREQDPARASAAEKALLATRRELGIENLVTLAAAEVRDSARALDANLAAEALAHAETAVQLAPDFADSYLALARARLAKVPAEPLAALGAVRDGLLAAAREPHTARAFLGDVFGAALAALFTTAAATVGLLFLRRFRLLLHDVHHLPLLRGSAEVQAGFLTLVVLALPVAFGLGPFVVLAVLAVAAWLYLGNAERAVATAALLALLALPWAAAGAARLTAWTGTMAETIRELEHGGPSDEEAAEIAARAAAGPQPAALYAALGRHFKRRGQLDAALEWYRRAGAADERTPEVQVNVGNVLFLKGDLDGAKAAYLAASDHAGGDVTTLAAAHYDLSKLYLRTSDMEKSGAARDRAEKEDGAFLRRYGSDEDFAANRYLVDVPVPGWKIRSLAAGDGSAEAVHANVQARIAAALPGWAWPWGGVILVAALWVIAFSVRGGGPSRGCERCGRPACKRCDGSSGVLCGQCVNVFQRRGVVDSRDRLRKEEQVRRHARLHEVVTRILAVIGGGAGHLWDGAPVTGALALLGLFFLGFVIWFWRGLLPPPHPAGSILACKLAVAAPAALVIWGLAVRSAFRRTGS
jgi:hypothetical protein